MDGGDRQDKEMPDFENADLLTLIDDVCGTRVSIKSIYIYNIIYVKHTYISLYEMLRYNIIQTCTALYCTHHVNYRNICPEDNAAVKKKKKK